MASTSSSSSVLCSHNLSNNKQSSHHINTHQFNTTLLPSSTVGKQLSIRSSISKFSKPLGRNFSQRSPRRRSSFKCSAVDSSVVPAALLFDCDGVLVDTEKDGHRVSFNDTFAEKELGVTWDVDLYGELLKIGGGKERMTAYFNQTGWPENAPNGEQERKEFIASLHK